MEQSSAEFFETEEQCIDTDPEEEEEWSPSEPSTPPALMPRITVVEHDPAWTDDFERIGKNLQYYLHLVGVKYICIEHIGSTSVSGLAAKPNIDIIIEVPDAENAEKAKEALIYEPPAPEHYKCYGDGGMMGRISLKTVDRTLVPDQSVYVFSNPL